MEQDKWVKELMETVIRLEEMKTVFVKEQNFSDANILRKAIKGIRELIKQNVPPPKQDK